MRKWTRLEGIQDKGGLWSKRMQKRGLVTEQGWWPGQEKSKDGRYPCSESPTWGWDGAGGKAQDSLCRNRRLRAMLLKAVKTPVSAGPGNKGLETLFLIFQMKKEWYWHHWAEKVRDATGCGAGADNSLPEDEPSPKPLLKSKHTGKHVWAEVAQLVEQLQCRSKSQGLYISPAYT